MGKEYYTVYGYKTFQTKTLGGSPLVKRVIAYSLETREEVMAVVVAAIRSGWFDITVE